jgi:AcrR family transcriptional regulator
VTTRDKLLSATADALRCDGFGGLSARTIAARANVNQALVFYHFGTMSEMVQAATRKSVDESVAYYRDRFAEVQSLSELLAVGRGLHDRERGTGNVALMAQVMAGAQQDLALATAAADAMKAWSEEIERTVARVLAGTAMADLIDTAGFAQAICAAFIGLELFEGVDPAGGAAALDALETLGSLLGIVEGLGPVASRTLRAKLQRSGR